MPAPEAPGTWTGYAVMLAATATILMLEATRVFVAYLVFVVDQSRRLELGTIALGVFLVIGLGGLLRRATGWRLALGVSAVVLVAARLVMQFWQSPEARVVLGALVIIGWGWLLTLMFQSLRDPAALGLLLGLALDVGIRIWFETIDLPWMPNGQAHATTVVLAAILGFALIMVISLDPPPVGNAPALSLMALGPGLVVFHLMAGNLGLAQTMLDTDFPPAAAILATGTILGLLISWLAVAPPSVDGTRNWFRSLRVEGPVAILVLATIGLISLWVSWQLPGISAVALLFGVAGNYVLLALALLGSEPGRWRVRGGVTPWLTTGLLLQAVLLFAYYTFTGPPALIVVAWVLLLAGAFANGSRATVNPAWQPPSLRVWVTIAAVFLVLVSTLQALTWSKPKEISPLPGVLRVMTYNIQAGFSRENIFDLEQTAQTIELNKPDIVILQEISRGWLVLTGIDEVMWLSQRLDMPFYFGAASDDGLWGNAILTRAPVSDEEVRKFTSSENFKRSAIGVAVETEAGPLWTFATHLDNPDGASEVRLEQVEQLLAFWNGRIPAVIAGDFNAPPDSDVVQRMYEASFDDSAALFGDATTSEDERRIDYIFTSPGIEVTKVRIDDIWTSDHLPVTTWLTLAE
ncbi:MAG TPA: endonuclease/exonuclease/phosphatase family protein [Thermomicrobiales bacterium]|nr:endonuclease/exonuclease/phosphatase family protein [Thermomicrobiales bacterium]